MYFLADPVRFGHACATFIPRDGKPLIIAAGIVELNLFHVTITNMFLICENLNYLLWIIVRSWEKPNSNVVVYHVTTVAIGYGLLKKCWPMVIGSVLRTAQSSLVETLHTRLRCCNYSISIKIVEQLNKCPVCYIKFVGGNDGERVLSSVEFYSVCTDEWRPGPTLNKPRWQAFYRLLITKIVTHWLFNTF